MAIILSVLYTTLPKDNNWNEVPYTILPLIEDICVMVVISARDRAREYLRNSANGATESGRSNRAGSEGPTGSRMQDLASRLSKSKPNPTGELGLVGLTNSIQVKKETVSHQGYESMA